jgi:hypothetical protein
MLKNTLLWLVDAGTNIPDGNEYWFRLINDEIKELLSVSVGPVAFRRPLTTLTMPSSLSTVSTHASTTSAVDDISAFTLALSSTTQSATRSTTITLTDELLDSQITAKPPGMSTGENAGVGVGVTAAILLVGAGAFLLGRSFHKKSIKIADHKDSQHYADKPELEAKATVLTEMDAASGAQVYELEGRDHDREMGPALEYGSQRARVVDEDDSCEAGNLDGINDLAEDSLTATKHTRRSGSS